MSAKSNSARYAQSRTDSRIGTGVRVEGNITFTGILLIQGDILGDVTCDADISGTLVVGQPGNVTGTIRAPHIIVGGRVTGPVHSSESIEIQPGASLAGDTCYKAIAVHPGGVIEGSLIPDRVSDPTGTMERDMPVADAGPVGQRYRGHSRGARALGWAAALIIAMAVIVLVNRYPASIAPPVADLGLKSSSSMNGTSAAQSKPVGNDGGQSGPSSVAGDEAPLVPRSDVATTGVDQIPPADVSVRPPDKVILVQGVNPLKPTDVFSVTSKEPSVLLRKKRQDPSDGTRIDISEGERITVPIAKNEIIRVAEGHNIMIFYQGRKVSQKIIESGAWLSFVPLTPGETSARE
ncbi:MAG: polymer-forming cytoskeletal protein [Proteobacteria bacterium]|nr:polymer-forming cytoskeletal protein [Pseudomonadota bacterium]